MVLILSEIQNFLGFQYTFFMTRNARNNLLKNTLKKSGLSIASYVFDSKTLPSLIVGAGKIMQFREKSPLFLSSQSAFFSQSTL